MLDFKLEKWDEIVELFSQESNFFKRDIAAYFFDKNADFIAIRFMTYALKI